ncbi:hypothetical protein AgCh_020442 [Apium graveolens]
MANPLYIQILKNGPFIPMIRVEESTDGDMVIPAHYAPKDLSKYTEPEKEKVSLDSGLQLILIESLDNVMHINIVNYDTAKQIWGKIEILCEGTEEVREESEDEQDDQVSVIQAIEQKNKGPQKQVVLELKEDEYYTLDELDEMDQKPKKVKKDKAYLELEANYEALLKKQSRKAYIIEGKSWDDTDVDDDDKEVGNYPLMAFEEGEATTLKSKVQTLTTIDLNASQYKETVENMSVEMFHIHTSLVENGKIMTLEEKQDFENNGILYLVDCVNGKGVASPQILQVQEQLKIAGKTKGWLTSSDVPPIKGFKDIEDFLLGGVNSPASDWKG